MKEFKASPKNWNKDYISISTENKYGDGRTVLHYFDRSIVLSYIIGCCDPMSITVEDDRVLWNSSHGRMATDGRNIERLSNIIEDDKNRRWTMRKFRYIKSLNKMEIDIADICFGIQTDGYHALTPVTKAEFKLLTDLNNMDWKVDEYRLPTYNSDTEVPVDRTGDCPKKPGAEKSWKLADDIPEPTKTIQPDGSAKLSSVVTERFIQMDQDIQGFIREEVKAELNRREEEDDDSYYNVDDDPPVKTGTVRICRECNEIVVRDPYNPNYCICGCDIFRQVESWDCDSIGAWRPARVEIRMK